MSMPWSVSFCATPGSFSAFASSSYMRFTIGCGVLARAITPHPASAPEPGTPSPATLFTARICRGRLGGLAAAGFRLPPFTGALAHNTSLKTKSLCSWGSDKTLGRERAGSGVVVAPQNVILSCGYLCRGAHQVECCSCWGRTFPAAGVAWGHATGFGLLGPIGALGVKAI